MTPCDEAAYVATLIMLYVDLPNTPLRPSPQDQATARRLYQANVPLSLAETALLLGTLRRLVRNSDLPPLAPIRSLAYFQPVITELQQQPLPNGYLDYLRVKFQKIAGPGPKVAPRL